MKNRITIHMGASTFTADVKTDNGVTHFNINDMEPRNQHRFRRELVKAFRDSQHD
jgi:hypothetical protein